VLHPYQTCYQRGRSGYRRGSRASPWPEAQPKIRHAPAAGNFDQVLEFSQIIHHKNPGVLGSRFEIHR
jgi:hypothetical protein